MAPTLLILIAMNTTLCRHVRMSNGGLCVTVVGMVIGVIAAAYILLTVKGFLVVRRKPKRGAGASPRRMTLTRALIKKDLSEEPLSTQFAQLVGYGILGIALLILTAQSDSGFVWSAIIVLLAILLGIGYSYGLLRLESLETHYQIKLTYNLTARSLSRAKAVVSAAFGFCFTLLLFCYGIVFEETQAVSMLIAIPVTIYIYFAVYPAGIIYLSRDWGKNNDNGVGIILIFCILSVVLSPLLFMVGIALSMQVLARRTKKR